MQCNKNNDTDKDATTAKAKAKAGKKQKAESCTNLVGEEMNRGINTNS